MKRKGSCGFSLFEILIIIALLALVMFFSFLFIPSQLVKARDAKRKSDLEQVKASLYDYYFDQNCFPTAIPSPGENFFLEETVYLPSFPGDPKEGGYYYQKEEGDCPQWFKILANLENSTDTGIVKTGCQFGCGPECDYNYGLSSSNIKVNAGCVAYFACSPSRRCIEYEDPWISDCPRVFENDPTCENSCGARDNRCHDERGKRVPG